MTSGAGLRMDFFNRPEIMDHWGRVILATSTTQGIRAVAAISIQPLPVHLLDGPAADLQSLGQFPLAHSLRPLHPDVLPLLLGQARPPAWETALGPRLRLAGDRPLPDRVPPPLAEGEHHRELELAGGRGRVEVFRQGPELHSSMVQALDHLQAVGQPPGEPVNVGDCLTSTIFAGWRRLFLPVHLCKRRR